MVRPKTIGCAKRRWVQGGVDQAGLDLARRSGGHSDGRGWEGGVLHRL